MCEKVSCYSGNPACSNGATTFSDTLFRQRIFVILLMVIFAVVACSAPKRAPVVSHEISKKKNSAAKYRPNVYKVRKGDTLFSIAWKFGLDQEKLAKWNRVSAPYTIYPGQKLRLTSPPKSASRIARRKPIKPAVKPAKKVKSARPAKSAAVPQPDKRVKTTPKQNKNSQNKSVNSSRDKVKLAWSWPARGAVKERFLPGDPARKGVKISGRVGQSVMAAESGKVVYAGSGLIGYGRLIIIKHNKNYLSAYGYNRKILVKEGDKVRKGAKIAEMGAHSKGGSLLHFEIRRNGTPVDPLKLLPRS